MNSKKWQRWLAWVCVAAAAGSLGRVAIAGPPAAPKVSTFAPAKDVAAQIGVYLTRLEEAVADEEAYKDAETRIAKDANTVILLALAAGLHDEENSYKAAASGLLKAAQELAKAAVVKEQAPGTQPSAEEVAKRYAAVKAAVAEVKKAAESKGGDASKLKWTKAAALPELMKQVPLINNRLKRNLRGERFKTRAKENAGDAAVLAVIAQGSMADTSEAKNPEDVKKWYDFCVQMRDAAGALNKAVRDGKQPAADKAAAALSQNCEDCHAVFKPGTDISGGDKEK